MSKQADRPVDEMTFEDAMSELEDVVAQLEQGKVFPGGFDQALRGGGPS